MAYVYDETKQGYAKRTFERLVQTLDNMRWKYKIDDNGYIIRTTAIGKDMEIALKMIVDPERQVFHIKSFLPFRVEENARVVVGRALHLANFSMLNGCFEYNEYDGYVGFRVVMPFAGCEVSEEMCHYMIILTCQMVDKFNDKILALSKGEMTYEEFGAFVENRFQAERSKAAKG